MHGRRAGEEQIAERIADLADTQLVAALGFTEHIEQLTHPLLVCA
jgi:hypothetical protein